MDTGTNVRTMEQRTPDINDNESPDEKNDPMEDDLTEERDATPKERADVADTQPQDP